jgi:hypothetical protein
VVLHPRRLTRLPRRSEVGLRDYSDVSVTRSTCGWRCRCHRCRRGRQDRRHPREAAALCPDGGVAGVRSDMAARVGIRRPRTADPGAFASTPGPRNRLPRRPRSRRSRSGSSAPIAEDRQQCWLPAPVAARPSSVLERRWRPSARQSEPVTGPRPGPAVATSRVWKLEDGRRRARGLIGRRETRNVATDAAPSSKRSTRV